MNVLEKITLLIKCLFTQFESSFFDDDLKTHIGFCIGHCIWAIIIDINAKQLESKHFHLVKSMLDLLEMIQLGYNSFNTSQSFDDFIVAVFEAILKPKIHSRIINVKRSSIDLLTSIILIRNSTDDGPGGQQNLHLKFHSFENCHFLADYFKHDNASKSLNRLVPSIINFICDAKIQGTRIDHQGSLIFFVLSPDEKILITRLEKIISLQLVQINSNMLLQISQDILSQFQSFCKSGDENKWIRYWTYCDLSLRIISKYQLVFCDALLSKDSIHHQINRNLIYFSVQIQSLLEKIDQSSDYRKVFCSKLSDDYLSRLVCSILSEPCSFHHLSLFLNLSFTDPNNDDSNEIIHHGKNTIALIISKVLEKMIASLVTHAPKIKLRPSSGISKKRLSTLRDASLDTFAMEKSVDKNIRAFLTNGTV